MPADPFTTFGEDDFWEDEGPPEAFRVVPPGNNMSHIPTWYRGELYRSRTEARWAVFLDHVAVSYRHEDQPYGINGRGFLPDFHLADRGIDVEVKGEGFVFNDADVQKFQGYADEGESRLLVVIGWPDVAKSSIPEWYGTLYSPRRQPMAATFAECRDCHRVGLLAHDGDSFDRSVWTDTSLCRCRVTSVVLVGPTINAAIATLKAYNWYQPQ